MPKLTSLLKSCLLINLVLLSIQAHAEYYLVQNAPESEPSMVFTSEEGCHSCSQWMRTCPFEEHDQIPDMTIKIVLMWI